MHEARRFKASEAMLRRRARPTPLGGRRDNLDLLHARILGDEGQEALLVFSARFDGGGQGPGSSLWRRPCGVDKDAGSGAALGNPPSQQVDVAAHDDGM